MSTYHCRSKQLGVGDAAAAIIPHDVTTAVPGVVLVVGRRDGPSPSDRRRRWLIVVAILVVVLLFVRILARRLQRSLRRAQIAVLAGRRIGVLADRVVEVGRVIAVLRISSWDF